MTRRLPWSALFIALSLLASSSPAAQAPATAHASAPTSTSAPVSTAAPKSLSGQSPATAPAGYSAPILYNWANAYARGGKPGLAVLNYERARLLDPQDPDIEANLRHVREASGLPQESRNRLERIAGIVGPQATPWIGVLGLLLAGTCALARRFYSGHRRKLLLATLLGITLLGLSIASGITLWPIMHEAVVVSRTAPVRVSPATIAEQLFELPEATIVNTSAEHDGFVLVRTTEGRTGWAPSASLAPIVPKQAAHTG